MTKKHFEAIARAIADATLYEEMTGEEMRTFLAKSLASVLAGTNAAFDRDRFLKACGL